MAARTVCLALGLALVGTSGCVRGQVTRAARTHPDAPSYECTKHVLGRGSTCSPVGPPRARQVQRVPVGSAATTRSSKGKLRVRIPYAGGQLEVIGQPSAHPTRVVLLLRPIARLGDAPCEARLFRDGALLSVDEVVRRRDHELLVALPVAHLRALHESVRFSAQYCGLQLELDPLGRRAMSDFEARFREELAR